MRFISLGSTRTASSLSEETELPPQAPSVNGVVAEQPKLAMPGKQPEFQGMSNREAVLEVAKRFGVPRPNEHYAKAIYDVQTDEEFALAKRTINSELARRAKDGDLMKIRKGWYVLKMRAVQEQAAR